MLGGMLLDQLILERNYGEAIQFVQGQLAQIHLTSEEKAARQVALALIQRLAGDNAVAKVTAEQACNTLEPLYRDKPDVLLRTRQLSFAYALVGKKDLALKLAERAVMVRPRAKDLLVEPAYEENLAFIQALVGENGRAISILAQLLQMPYAGGAHSAPITPALLRLDPILDPLRSDPAFQKFCQEKQP
jgi:tetratricopeptide (TPR) repeat protein